MNCNFTLSYVCSIHDYIGSLKENIRIIQLDLRDQVFWNPLVIASTFHVMGSCHFKLGVFWSHHNLMQKVMNVCKMHYKHMSFEQLSCTGEIFCDTRKFANLPL